MSTETRILVVEDESSLRELYREALETEGFDVSTARDGIEGLELFDQDSRYLIQSIDKDLAVANLVGIGYPADHLDNGLYPIVVNGNLELDLG